MILIRENLEDFLQTDVFSKIFVVFFLLLDKGVGVVATPHGFLPRDSHEISPTIGGGTQVDDFNKGFSKGFFLDFSYLSWFFLVLTFSSPPMRFGIRILITGANL